MAVRIALLAGSLYLAFASQGAQPTDKDVVESQANLAAKKGESTTPVGKVISLLKRLEEQVAEEGKEEAAAYDKYACFCKEQADEKLYQIETSDKKIARLDAEIKQIDADVSSLNQETADLNKVVSEKEWEIGNATAERAKAHDEYVTKEADAAGAVDACVRAIEALKNSKSALGGKSNKEALVQLRSAAREALEFGSAFAALNEKELLALHDVIGQPGAAYQYEYHSNDIISVIEDLKKKFTELKNNLDEAEFQAKAAFDEKVLGLSNEKKFAEKAKEQKAKIIAHKEEVRGQKQEEMDEENADKTADDKFMKVLTDECQEKAGYFDQRSKSRAAETTALAEAIETLETGVKANYAANKKLAGLAVKNRKPHRKGHWVYIEEPVAVPAAKSQKALAFVQLHSQGGNPSWKGKVLELLSNEATRLNSPVLSSIALKVQASADHFVKVRQLIKDIIANLEAQANSEMTQKQFCDKEMKKAVTDRDDEAQKIEENTAKIETTEGDIFNLKKEVAELSDAIAANKKSLLEETELRNEEKGENEATIAKAGAGKEAVDKAIQVLKDYYEAQGADPNAEPAASASSGGFLQYVPDKADRDGNSVSDLAPEVFDGEYSGKKSESKGIIGMLEVIQADFERTVSTVTDEETTSSDDYDSVKSTNEADTSTKEKAVKDKNKEISDKEDDLIGFQNALETAKKDKKLADDELMKLEKMCVEGEESHEERVANREKEIAALKEAQDILENYKDF